MEADFQHYYQLDLRREYLHTSCRRVFALIKGLPPGSAIWRKDSFPPVEEMLVQFIERHDEWSHALLMALLGHKRVATPAPFQILRPGEDEEPKRPSIETDPRVIAAWFHENIG